MTMNKTLKPRWQVDSRKAWVYMLLYWVCGWILGLRRGYLSMALTWRPTPFTKSHSRVLLLTIAAQLYLNVTRFSSFGRRRDYAGIAIFAIGNGTAETMFFLASYDLGRQVLARKMGLSRLQDIALGFAIYSIYATLIHLFFWLPFVFPRHLRPDVKPFCTFALPAYVVFSVAWLYIYESYGDVLVVCLFHGIVNAMAGYAIGFPSLSENQGVVCPVNDF